MKKLIILLFLIISSVLFGQVDFKNIDDNSKNIPKHLTTAEDIAYHLTKDLNTDEEKIRALYVWVAHNIEYDVSYLDGEARYASTDKILKEVLTKRKGVCQHYSDLFNAMANSIGINSITVLGYVKDINGGIFNYDHCWNAVKIGSDYHLIDVTWSSGYLHNNKFIREFSDEYFMVEPMVFIKSHIPFDPVWQFLSNPITHTEFKNNDFSKLDISGSFLFEDHIYNMESLDKIARLEQTNKRIIESGITNQLIKTHIEENDIHITIEKLNKAIDSLNYGIKNFNMYREVKDKKFLNQETKNLEIGKLLFNAESSINYANNLLSLIITKDLDLKNMVINTKKTISQILTEIKKEKEIISKYYKNSKYLS